MALPRSPLAPAKWPDMPVIAGCQLGSYACGIRYKSREDLCLIELAAGASIAGVFTQSKTAGAPVEWCRTALAHGRGRGIVVTAGNSNAFTGRAGRESVARTVDAAAAILECPREEIFVASTGVIGEPLPHRLVVDNLPILRNRLVGRAWEQAAAAITTTDTFPKYATRTATIGGVEVTINGIAKGSGMIQPDMATMLAFVVTDATIPPDVLQRLLVKGNDKSFNAITVDGDTSTSDTLLLAATGQAGNKPPTGPTDRSLAGFRKALDSLFVELAQLIVRDGEGAQKFVTINVAGATSPQAARKVGLAIGNSPLVKTAIAGEDANWGRIVMAVGKSGEKADRDKLAIAIGGTEVARDGEVVPGYDESPVAEHMKGQEIEIDVDLGVGRGKATVWTCDLTHGYIDINADYRS